MRSNLFLSFLRQREELCFFLNRTSDDVTTTWPPNEVKSGYFTSFRHVKMVHSIRLKVTKFEKYPIVCLF